MPASIGLPQAHLVREQIAARVRRNDALDEFGLVRQRLGPRRAHSRPTRTGWGVAQVDEFGPRGFDVELIHRSTVVRAGFWRMGLGRHSRGRAQ